MSSKFSFLSALLENSADLKNANKTDAGKNDVVDKTDDVHFISARNKINAEQEVTGEFVADFINKAEELNNEVDTVVFGVETDDDYIIKVYVAADQADKFEETLAAKLGLDDDIEEVLNDLALDFDIVDVVWPKAKEGESTDDPEIEDSSVDAEEPEGEDASGESDDLDAEIAAALATDGEDDDDAFTDTDDFEVVSAIPPDGSDTVETKDEKGSAEVDVTEPLDDEDLPAPDDNGEDATPWMRLNDIVLTVFKDDDSITGVNSLTHEQLSKVIDIEKADEIATTQYEAADFAALEDDEKEEIINANPKLILSDKSADKEDEVNDTADSKSDTEKEPTDSKPDKEAGEPKKDVKQESLKRFSFLSSL